MFPLYAIAAIVTLLLYFLFRRLFFWFFDGVSFDLNFDFFLLFTECESVMIDFGFGHAFVLCEVDHIGLLVEGADSGVGEVFSGALFEKGTRLSFAFFRHLNL